MNSLPMSRRGCLAALASVVTVPALARKLSSSRYLWMYVGTYTGGKSEGIYLYRYDAATGAVEARGLAAKCSNPTFLAVHPNGKFLYSANEAGKWRGQDGGYTSAFSIDSKTGALTLLNEQSTVGGGPCHLNVDATGKALLLANYGGGSTVVCPILKNGSLAPHSAFIQHRGSSVNSSRQKEPHAHSINLSPDNRFALVADLGLDQILVYRFNARKGTLAPHDPPSARLAPGSGPRHLTFSPNGRWVHVINELNCTMTTFRWDASRGILTEIQTLSTLPAGETYQPSYSTAEVRAHPNGRTVYGSNRGHHTIAVFSVESDGRLAPVQHVSTQGRTPRNFNLTPQGDFLFAENQDTHDFHQYRVDPTKGTLTPTGLRFEVGSPVCIRFAPAA